MTASPACWSWPATTDLGADCPEYLAHVLLWNWQRGRCANCGVDAGPRVRFVRDHDHNSGLLRGLLCQSCNVVQGWSIRVARPGFVGSDGRTYVRWRTDPVKLERSARLALYVSRPPSVLLGITASHAATKGSRAPRLPTAYTEPLPMLARMPRRPKRD